MATQTGCATSHHCLPINANPKRKSQQGKINPFAQSCTPFHSLGTHSDAPPGSS